MTIEIMTFHIRNGRSFHGYVAVYQGVGFWGSGKTLENADVYKVYMLLFAVLEW